MRPANVLALALSLTHLFYQLDAFSITCSLQRHLFTRRQRPVLPRLNLFAHRNAVDEDINGYVESEYIPLDCDTDFISVGEKPPSPKRLDIDSLVNMVIPIVTPLVAFLTYDELARGFDFIFDILETKNWVAVDGGAYQAKIIAPAINGIVVPSIAILFATLTSTTITTLRNRQYEIRGAINTEASELRALESLLDAFPRSETRDRCRTYLIQYTNRIISESSPIHGSGSNVVNPRRGMDSELNAFMAVLNNHRVNGSNDSSIPVYIISEAFASVSKLRDHRVTRITALQSTYPSLHYAILGVLASSLCTAFLIETDQEYLLFLNAVQLKILWSMLVGTFVACFVVFMDLRSPFAGSYQISASVDQLHTIRNTLKASVEYDRRAEECSIPNGEHSVTQVRGKIESK